MKAILRFVCLAVLSLGFLMCSKNGEGGGSASAPEISIKTPVVGADGGQQFLSVEAGGAWTLSSTADWIQFSPESGVGDFPAVILSYEENVSGTLRTATILATVGNKTGSTVLSQNGKGGQSVVPHLEPEESSYTVGAAGGTLEVRLNTNVKYTSSVSQSAVSWIHVSQAHANIFTIDEYTGEDTRTGTITFASLDGAVSVPVTVVQNASSVQPAATVTTGASDGVTTSSAVLSGYYSAASSSPVEAGFYWGTSSQPTTVAKLSSAPSGTASEFSTGLSGLAEKTTYYYQAYVIVREKSGEQTFKGAVRSFTTEESTIGPDPVVTGDQKGWYELPLMNISVSGDYMFDTENPSDYFAYHICPDLYTSGNKKARNYTICFSGEHHCPLWVAAPRHSMYEGGSGRSEAYKIDPDIPADIQYKSKSAGSGSGCNRGHMLGSAERTATSQTNAQVFYLSNIAPQLSSGFNTGGGGWNTLEGWVDGQVCSDTLYVVIGTYFDKFTDGYGNTVQPKKITYAGRDDVSFPTMFYYVLMRTKKGSSGKALKDCAASEIKCAAFVRAHTNSLKGQKVTSKEMMSVSALEQITGITYFQNVPNAPKTTATASDWGL